MLRVTSQRMCRAAAGAATVSAASGAHNSLQEHAAHEQNSILDADGLPPMPPMSKPYVPPPPFPHRPRKGIETPEYYNSRSAIGHPDPLALELTAGRSDPEWQWLKFLCFICVVPTFGSYLYQIFFPQNMKWFKDEPWSPFRH